MNKRRERTAQLIALGRRRALAEQIQNTLEQRRFDRLVSSGIIRTVQLNDRTLLLGTEIGVEPPMSVENDNKQAIERDKERVVVHLDTENGNDNNDGRQPYEPVKTLERALRRKKHA